MGLASSSSSSNIPNIPTIPTHPAAHSHPRLLILFLKLHNMKLKPEIQLSLILFIGTSRIYLRLLSAPLIVAAPTADAASRPDAGVTDDFLWCFNGSLIACGSLLSCLTASHPLPSCHCLTPLQHASKASQP